MTILRIGSTPKYASNFDKAFQGGKKKVSSRATGKTARKKKK